MTDPDPYAIALQTAAAGLKVVPIRPGQKHPPLASWQKAATVDPDIIRKWWNGLYKGHGVGIALGPQPDGRNVFALDIDRHGDVDGMVALADLEGAHGTLPRTVESLTGGDGCHLLFTAPPDAIVRNQQADGNRVAPGIDIRGAGGQIVVYPTIHPDTGKRYEWGARQAPWEHEIAEAPAWLLDLVVEQPAPPRDRHEWPDYRGAIKPNYAFSEATPASGDSIADEMRRTWNWDNELTARGWKFGHATGTDTYWTRPGDKEPRDGHSAVVHDGDVLVVWTTSLPPAFTRTGIVTRDGSGRSFSPFQFYAASDHDGDLSAAGRTLREAKNAANVVVGSAVPPALTTPPAATQGPETCPCCGSTNTRSET